MNPCFSFSDEELVSHLREGNVDAYSEIYRRYWPILYRHAMRMLKNEEESEDAVQESFITLWKTSAVLEEKTVLGAYLYTLLRNRILGIFRRSAVQSSYIESLGDFMDSGYELTDYAIREKILAALIEQEIENLPARMREVFELKRKQNLSYKQISQVMNISELTVKTQMNKAITILRKKFGDHLTVMFPFL